MERRPSQQIPWLTMSRRIEIELTSARPDGTWTWRAAGAQKPKGVLDGGLLPNGAATGLVLRAEAEFELDGITILSVTGTKEKSDKGNLLAFIPSDRPFEEVTQQLAKRDRGDRGDRPPRRDGDRPQRRDRPPRGDGAPRRDGPGGDRPPRSDGAPRRDGPGGDRGPRPDRGPGGDRAPRTDRGPRPERRQRPSFTAPPELPQRPKAKRLKPGRAHRNAVLAELPEEQRPVAERALQGGIPAVRQAVIEQNARLKAEGQPEVPAAGLLALAEQLLPKLRVAEWLDRADAATSDIEELDLRDLRSVVAASEDPVVARDETTRELAASLKTALATKQEKELNLWFGDIDAAIGVGRIVRALKLSSQPPKAGIRFPAELATRLIDATNASLTADSLPDRWVAVLEAAAFAPIHTHVTAAAKPQQSSDELTATVTRVASLLPQIAALFEVEVRQGAHSPKPLRPTRPVKKAPPKPPAPPAPKPAAAAPKPAPAEAAAEPETAAEPTPESAEPAEAVAATAPATDAVTEAVESEAVESEAAPEPAAAEASDTDASTDAVEPEAAPEPVAATEPAEPTSTEATPEPVAATEPATDAVEPEATPEPVAATEPATEPTSTEDSTD